MPVTVTLSDALIRLALAFLGGAVIGFNREERNEAAGMRTTMLVCMAACLAALLANFLLNTTGKNPGYFSQIDVLRLPLGILSGIGFIGAGAIIKKGDIALGVTTAATMWFMSVVGLCFGAGQLGLGLAGIILGLVILWALKWFDERMPRAMRATLLVRSSTLEEAALKALIESYHYKIVLISIRLDDGGRCIEAVVQWHGRQEEAARITSILDAFKREGVKEVSWAPGPAPS